MKKQLLGTLCLVWALTSYAQTNYEEIPLEGTPITVTERKEDPASQSSLFNGDLQLASTASASAGGSAISETMGRSFGFPHRGSGVLGTDQSASRYQRCGADHRYHL